MRNAAKNARETAVRRQAMLDEGFRLISERGIDSVSMREVASACGLGIATPYRYFQSKLSLAIEIGSTQWPTSKRPKVLP